MQPDIKAFFHEDTFTVSYVVTDPATQRCAVVDSVLDYDPPPAAPVRFRPTTSSRMCGGAA